MYIVILAICKYKKVYYKLSTHIEKDLGWIPGKKVVVTLKVVTKLNQNIIKVHNLGWTSQENNM